MYQLNHSVTFSGQPIGSEDKEFLNQMIKALDIIIDRRSKKKELVKWKAKP
jgi:hypothetical protein